MAEYLKGQRPQCDVYLVGTVWENLNCGGAMMAARTIHPDIAISLDFCLGWRYKRSEQQIR
jgi:putative aminopeptidase FrvX